MEISHITESTWPGLLGHAFVILSFIAAALSFVAFAIGAKNPGFLKLARWSFNIHGISVIGIAGTLFLMLFNHYFEYQYVYQHSSKSMDMKYILSCFWEGQEGSFLLWTFWNMVLGLILKRQLKNGEWEGSVMAVFALVQVFLSSMLLGIYIGDYRIGSSPFLLLRDHPDFSRLPFLQLANYLEKIDGRGLNPLLMNYWMTIHPPTLFLGFASTLVPFAFSIGALWNKKHDKWQTIALPWTFFGILILGIGILMGGAWAYEALNFGGFWAWDPVENSSLVPWLVLVAAGHTMIINKNRGGSLFTTHFLAIGSFLLVLYSTFLTRSGVLGNASVHAFTDLGMQGQLVIYVLTFIFISVMLMIENLLLKVSYIVGSFYLLFIAFVYGWIKIPLLIWLLGSAVMMVVSYINYFPKEENEEDLFTREFWLFLGSLVLLLSSLIITYFTSSPVINKLFGTDIAPHKVPVYNAWMLPFAILLAFLMATGLYLKYKKTDTKVFFRRVGICFLLALVFGLACVIPLYFISPEHVGLMEVGYALLFIFTLFGVFTNADYWLNILKGKISKSGAAIAHIGFILILLGALVSTSKKINVSKNTASRKVSELGEGYDDKVSILLTQGDTLPMGPYLVTYTGKERKGIDVYFKVDYLKPGKNNKSEYDFTLVPHVQDNPRMGKAPEPATKHYLNRDLYTHVTYAILTVDTSKAFKNSYTEAKNYIGHMGDTIFAGNAFVIIDSLRTNINKEEYLKDDSQLEVTAVLRAVDQQSNMYYAYPKYVIKNNVVIPQDDVIEKLGLKFVFWKINPEEGTIEVTMSEKASNSKDFIVMEAYVFPYINILWIGCLVMAIGTIIAIIERIRKFKLQSR